MKKIKVMHFVSGLVSGGVEQMLYNYCGHMDHNKYDFLIVYQHEPIQSCIDKIHSAGCRTIRITARSENFLKNIQDSIAIIKVEKPDIVHAHMNLMNFCALYAAKKCGVRVRISHSHIAEKNRGILFRTVAVFAKALCVRYATNFVTCGKEAGEYLYGKKRMLNNKVFLVENAIDLDNFERNEQERKEFRKQYNIEESFVIGHVGRFSYQKNHDRLLDIFCELLKIQRNAILLLVGTGELENDIKRKIEQLGLKNKVIMYGTTKYMRPLYSAMDVFILPSRYEGFPVVSIEIQAANIPSIFSKTIAKTCKITDAISFMDLDEPDSYWAEALVNKFENFRPCDLTELRELYDIKSKAMLLDSYYSNLLKVREELWKK